MVSSTVQSETIHWPSEPLGVASSISAVGTFLAGQATTIANHHINRRFLDGDVAGAQREQIRRPPDPPTENDVRGAVERVTVSATRIESF